MRYRRRIFPADSSNTKYSGVITKIPHIPATQYTTRANFILSSF